ncbi:MAG: hypothetical protein KDC95_16095, partial [Planctomycetes bacterium]|nr:hypothetical protein [Planctomycetota bacterium]
RFVVVKRVLWLNLDADLELESDHYRRSSRMRAQIAALARRLEVARSTVTARSGDPWPRLLDCEFLVPNLDDDRGEPRDAVPSRRSPAQPVACRDAPSRESSEVAREPAGERDAYADAWCPTPSALAALARRGYTAGSTPPVDVLRRVNHRSFCTSLGTTLPAEAFVRSLDELDEHLEALQATCRRLQLAQRCVLKRPFGFSGRARKILDPAAWRRGDGEPTRRWAEASMNSYGNGLQVEPWVDVESEFSIHGIVDRDGRARFGIPRVLQCDANGAWEQSRDAIVGELDDQEIESLEREAQRCAGALASAAYHGPFGVDAFRWRDARGRVHFRPRSELNARFTMGFF